MRALSILPRETYGIFLAQRGTNQCCIVVQHVDLTASSSCAGANIVAQDGLQLQAVVLDRVDFEEVGSLKLLDLIVYWKADGTLEISSRPQAEGTNAREG